MTELTRTINNINELGMAQSDITSLQESVLIIAFEPNAIDPSNAESPG